MDKNRSRFWQLTEFLDWTARDVRGQAVGRVADVIVDSAEGRIAYLRILMNRPTTGSENQITVPWSAISRISEPEQEIWIAARQATLLRLGSARMRSGPPAGA